MSAADIVEDFPAIGAAQVRACLLYAACRERIVLQATAKWERATGITGRNSLPFGSQAFILRLTLP